MAAEAAGPAGEEPLEEGRQKAGLTAAAAAGDNVDPTLPTPQYFEALGKRQMNLITRYVVCRLLWSEEALGYAFLFSATAAVTLNFSEDA